MLNLKNNYICAVDIGSSKIAASVAEIKNKRITNIFFETSPSAGISKGLLVDSLDLVDSLSKVLKDLKAKSGINIKFIHTNISGGDLITKHSHAIIPLAERGNKVITLSDVQKATRQARILGANLEEEIIHAMPFNYAIDSTKSVSNPLGLYSHRLEVDLYLICSKLSSIQSLTRAINQTGYEIKDLFFSGVATSKAILFDKEFKSGLNVICDIGSDITELLLFKDGVLEHVDILALGGADLTLQLSEDLKIPFDLAEDIKRSYVSVGDIGALKQDKQILVKKNNIYTPIDRVLVSDIVNAKTKTLCLQLKEAVEKNTPCDRIDNFSAVGRAVLLEGFLETLESTLGVSVKLGRIINPDIVSLLNKDDGLSGQKYLTYVTCLGIICQALHGQQTLELPRNNRPSRNFLLNAVDKLKDLYQEYF